MQTVEPFQRKRALVICSCGNNGYVLESFPSVTLARYAVQLSKYRIQKKAGYTEKHFINNFPIPNEHKNVMLHIYQGHKVKVYVP